jgi:hypothetical protein
VSQTIRFLPAACLPSCLPAFVIYAATLVMWDAIKAACQSQDMATARLILETAGIIVARHDMTVMYDERGSKYELPKYVLCEPSNLLRGEAAEQQRQLEMAQRQQQAQAVQV